MTSQSDTSRKLLLARRVGALAMVVMMFGLGGVMCQRVADRGRYAAAYSSISAGPAGTRGLFELAEDLGANPIRWHQDLLELPATAMLVALSGCEGSTQRGLTDLEAKLLLSFMEDGGTLLVAGAEEFLQDPLPVTLVRDPEQCAGTAGVLSKLKKAQSGDEVEETLKKLPAAFQADPKAIAEAIETDEPPPAKLVDSVDGTATNGLGSLPMRQLAMIESESSELERLYEIDGDAAAVHLKVGKGHLLVFSSATMFQNRELLTSDGGVLFARLISRFAPGGTVVFDEYHIGIGAQRSTVRYLRDLGFGALLLQLVVILLFVLWRYGVRFGTFRPVAESPAAGDAAFIDSMAGLYLKSGDHQSAAEVIREEAMMRVSQHHRLSASSSALSRKGVDTVSVRKALSDRKLESARVAVDQILTLSIPDITSQRNLVAFAKRLDQLTAIALNSTPTKVDRD